MSPRTAFALLCLLVTTSARAEIYRCTIDGRTTYRDRPCVAGEQQATRLAARASIEGCYSVETAGWESGPSTGLMRIRNTAGRYTLESLAEKGKVATSLALRRATATEVRDATKLLKLDVVEGMVLVVPAGAPNQPALPIGLYKGRDEYRDFRYFLFGFFANGWAKPTACP